MLIAEYDILIRNEKVGWMEIRPNRATLYSNEEDALADGSDEAAIAGYEDSEELRSWIAGQFARYFHEEHGIDELTFDDVEFGVKFGAEELESSDPSCDALYMFYMDALWEKNYDNCQDDMEYDDIYYWEPFLAIEHFVNPTFNDLLAEWYDYCDMDMEEKVRGYVKTDKGFLMGHGVGYDWQSSDLFGGSANGRACSEFDSWCREQGIYVDKGYY